MWIKLITQPSPKLIVQAVPQKSGEPVTDGALMPLLPQVATTALPSPLARNSLCPGLSICLSSHSSLITELLGCQRILFSFHSFLCQTTSALPFVLTLAPPIQHCRPPEKYRDSTNRSKQSNFPWKGERGKMHLYSFSNQHKRVWNH